MRVWFAAAALTLSGGCSTPPADAPAVEPLEIRTGTVSSVDGLSLAYSEAGSGPALVFVHGWCCHRGHWADQLEAFADRYRVVALDLAGHGESGAERGEWTFQSLGADVRSLVEALGLDDVVLIGHSLGGPVSLLAAGELPGRVRAVVGVDSLHDADFRFEPELFERLATSYEQEFVATCRTFVTGMFLPDADPVLVGRVRDEMCASPQEVAVPLFRAMPAFDMAEAMRRAAVPIRCINAARHPTRTDANRQYADFDVVTMEEVGHFPMLERPDAFNDLLAEVLDGLGVESGR